MSIFAAGVTCADPLRNATEYNGRRRLVQFFRRQNGGNVSADFRVISQAECAEQQHLGHQAMIVSCIFNERENRCYITSVDLIHLIEQLVMGGGQFTVEEKNRIRRNLEGFKPQTIAKGKASTAAFFKLIMEFPVPKPRNIEKDIKVFPWECVGEALEKIVSKYVSQFGDSRWANLTSSSLPATPSACPTIHHHTTATHTKPLLCLLRLCVKPLPTTLRQRWAPRHP